ncbi:glycosyltransferase family 4 protein [Tabrizicola fusiformis]|uniref:glycosyltransferase family 4 protein n=1 Tax=Tabrizicola sp. SY72 TaxID=2741673 RepID=UPI001574C262|nr:glycosyltransferase family 4 protein [Tabrizicola sp. SY72]NTT87268.1 glycosyltransferase family 4 protein [Tabrizicola sp. SY72]
MTITGRLRALLARPALRRTALFDAEWYLASYPDLCPPGKPPADPALHYLAHGATEGRDPGPLFSTSGYRLQGGPARGNPLLNHLSGAGGQALPVFAGTGGAAPPGAPVVLFFGHQAQGQQFGAERSLLTMLERAGRAGLAVELVLPHCQSADYLNACRARARAVHLLPYPWRRAGVPPHPATLAAMEALIRRSGAVEVHQNTAVLDAPLVAARAAGVASVVHLRELPAEDEALCARLGLPAEALRHALLTQADRFVANSEAVARWLDPAGQMPQGRMVILPNVVDSGLSALPFAPADPPRVALISSNTAKKGIADMVATARAFAALGGRAEFRFIGPASADLAALGPLPSNLRHWGYAATPVAALAEADVVLCLSHFAESFGRSVLEAMAAGRPVVTYDRGTPPALLAGSGAGLVVPADDPAAVAQALGTLLSDPAALRAASQAGRVRAAVLAEAAAAVPDALIFAQALGNAHNLGGKS